MPFAPFVIVTATTETIRGRSRVRVNEAYTNALVAVGLIPIILPPVDPVLAVAAMTDIAGLVLTGGEDIDPHRFGQEPHPQTGTPHAGRDAYEIALARAAYERRVPTLAICRGAQVMNVALGGTLVQDIATQHPGGIDHDQSGRRNDRVHEIEIARTSRLADIVSSTNIFANSSHHQSVDRVGDGLRVVATSPDGIVEGVEATDPAWWMVAVQWHPEELTATAEDWDRRLFSAFADEVRAAGRD
jgi:putative glutamine amidotransferase